MKLGKCLRDNSLQFNCYRLFHSKNFIGKNFDKTKKLFTDKNDLIGERDLINDYLVEINEIHYTFFFIFVFLCAITLVFSVICVFTSLGFLTQMISLSTSFFFYLFARYKKVQLVLNNMGIEFSKSFYDYKIMGINNKQ